MSLHAFWKIALCSSILVPVVPMPLQAQYYYDGWSGAGYAQPRARARPKVRPKVRSEKRLRPVEAAQRKPEGPLFAVVSLSEQKISIHDSSGLIARSPVSTGKTGHRTPTGIFSIIQKNRWHRSNIYSGAPMPFMQRITWSGIALHEGMLPGYPASHGCIRLPRSFAMQLWGMTRLGARVVVAPHDVSITSIDSAALPKPVFVPAAVADGAAAVHQTRIAAAGGATDSVPDASTAAAGPRMLNPVENAAAERVRHRVSASDAAKAAKAAHEAAQKAAAEAREAAVELKRAEARLAAARGETQRADLELVVADARARDAVRSSAAASAAAAAREAQEASDAAAKALKTAERAVEPMHVFISRKEKKLYVRQGFTPLFDAPVTFKDPDLAVGTHLFTALGPDGSGVDLRWNALTMPERSGASEREPVRRGKRATVAAPAVTPVAIAPITALARVEIPAETMRRLSERVWTGASLIISDHGMSTETGLGTDFVVLTR